MSPDEHKRNCVLNERPLVKIYIVTKKEETKSNKCSKKLKKLLHTPLVRTVVFREVYPPNLYLPFADRSPLVSATCPHSLRLFSVKFSLLDVGSFSLVK